MRILLATIAAALSATAAAQEDSSPTAIEAPAVGVAPANVLPGWTALTLLDAPAIGAEGEEIGEVENIVVGPDGRILYLNIETGGFLGIGDTVFSVPWDEARIAEDAQSVAVPIAEGEIDRYRLYDRGLEGLETTPRSWRVTELLNDDVRLEDGALFGVVQDLLFSADGEIRGVVANPALGFGLAQPYAFPFVGFEVGYVPELDYWVAPYGTEEIAEMEPFEGSFPPYEPRRLGDDAE